MSEIISNVETSQCPGLVIVSKSTFITCSANVLVYNGYWNSSVASLHLPVTTSSQTLFNLFGWLEYNCFSLTTVAFLFPSDNDSHVLIVLGSRVIWREYCRNSSLVLDSGCGSKTSTSITFSEIFSHSSLRTSCSLTRASDTGTVTSSKCCRGWLFKLGESVDWMSCDSIG